MNWALALDPPLDPLPEQARESLRRELLHSDYHSDDLMARLIDWLRRFVLNIFDAASQAPPLSAFVAMLVALLLGLALAWLATRTRRARRVAEDGGAVLPDDSITAAQWRTRAEQALAAGRHSEALVDGFRALALSQAERGRLTATPGMTAHEVATALQSAYPRQGRQVSEAARLFDLVRYGDRDATREQAALVLDLDDDLVGRR